MELSSREILVETFEEGVHMNDFLEEVVSNREREEDFSELRKDVADAGVDMLLKMVSHSHVMVISNLETTIDGRSYWDFLGYPPP